MTPIYFAKDKDHIPQTEYQHVHNHNKISITMIYIMKFTVCLPQKTMLK